MSPASMHHLAKAFGDGARSALLDGDEATARFLFALGAAHEAAAFSIEAARERAREHSPDAAPPSFNVTPFRIHNGGRD